MRRFGNYMAQRHRRIAQRWERHPYLLTGVIALNIGLRLFTLKMKRDKEFEARMEARFNTFMDTHPKIEQIMNKALRVA